MTGLVQPRVLNAPGFAVTRAQDAVAVAATAGVHLDDAQRLVLEHAMGERPDGLWAARTVAVLQARQNGKSTLLAARALLGLFVLGETVLWSAHQFRTTMNSFEFLKQLIDATPSMAKRVKHIRTSNGTESIASKDGGQIRFIARSKNSGRGLSADLVLCDEAQELGAMAMAAIMPTMSARPNPQLWLVGTVPSPLNNDASVFTNVRDAGRAGSDPELAWIEWSAGEDFGDLDDPVRWAAANPAFGSRIPADFVRNERSVLSDEDFARERLSIWPSGSNAGVFGSSWDDCIDGGSKITGQLALGVAVSMDRSHACVGVSGSTADGLLHLEPIDYRRGTSWVVDRVVELHGRHGRPTVVVDARGPASSLVRDLEDAGVPVTLANTQDVTDACAHVFDVVLEGKARHLADPDLDAAVLGAKKRPVGDRWAIGRRGSTDVSPLEAVVLAAWGARASADYDLMASAW